MRNMIHGPCGNWCLVDGKCSMHYPKPYLEETKMDEDAFIIEEIMARVSNVLVNI